MDSNSNTTRRPRVVIIGGGFGGIAVARKLAGAPVDVLLIDRNNYHAFWPLMYQVATAGLEVQDIVQPIRALLWKMPNVHFQLATADCIDLEAQTVLTDAGAIRYDELVIAAGSANNFFGLHEIETHGFGFKEMPEALAIRNHIITRFEQAESETDPEKLRRLLTFVVVGGGPTGVELAGALAELIRHVMHRDHPNLDFRNVRLLLVEMMDRLIPSFPGSLSRNAQRTLERLGVEVRLRTSVAGMRNGALQLKDGTEIQTDTVIWSAGVQGAPIGATLGVKLQRGGRIPVTPELQLPGHPNVWVIGDLAYLEAPDGKPYPQLAAVAMQQGPTVARNILRKLRGESLRPFRYIDKGTMATVGRRSAVARIWGINWTGSIAWLLWLAVHLLYLMGGRNRLVVFVNWLYSYLTYDRAARAVIAPSRHAQAAAEVVQLSNQPVLSARS